jgi:1-acyl-sn-glycerol-3-phosphate acyltransferase
MLLLRRVYSIWVIFWFLSIFLMLYPWFWLFIQKKSWQRHSVILNKIWSYSVFFLSGLYIEKKFLFKPKANGQYVYCANHGSYLDIAMLVNLLPDFFAFIGKKSISKVPLFGYMFTSLHVTVDRSSRADSYKSLVTAMEKAAEGRSIAIFPEGKIDEKIQPGLAPFKDGAFRIAISKQIPVVPVCMPYNWYILPDDGKVLPHLRKAVAIIHEPISTQGMTEDDIPALRQQVYDILAADIVAYNQPNS